MEACVYSSPSSNQGHDLAHILATFLYERLFGANMADGERAHRATLKGQAGAQIQTLGWDTLTMAQVTWRRHMV